ncbi:B3 domain-containing protein [Cardamine amara subsp. amara]|uniref:B3 domain-containing protein n=1 Tax=Cardamine amara subsp. amara TaxID=228776 RepID=A0ABD0ZMX7_CARAN
MASSNNDFVRFQEERKRKSFFKVLQRVDIFSENTRALPHDFVRNFSDDELSHKMKIKGQWGSSWELQISKNPRFYYMEKSGWEKFVKDNALGDNEFLSFTHKRKMSFDVNIFKQDGKEMLLPPQSRTYLASSSRVKTEQGEVMVSSDLRDPDPRTQDESNGGGQYKRKLNFEKKKDEESKRSKRTEKMVNVYQDSADASSSSVKEFTVIFQKSYLRLQAIPTSAAKDYMPDKKTKFKIHHPNGKKSWIIVYAPHETKPRFYGGWPKLVKEYPITVGDKCKFTLIKPDELVLVVNVRRDSADVSSSSSVNGFTKIIHQTHLRNQLRIPDSAVKDHMPKESMKFKIHHPDGKKSWIVNYCAYEKYSCFYGGWDNVVKEYPIVAEDKCTFTLIKPDELVLVVSKVIYSCQG